MIEILDPTGEVSQEENQLVRLGPVDSRRKVVGFLDNGKHNVQALFTILEEQLSHSDPLSKSIRAKKPVTSKPAPDELLSELAQHCDVVVNGVGD